MLCYAVECASVNFRRLVLFTQTLQAGDIFVLPRGLVHFPVQPEPQRTRTVDLAVSAFGSASPGTVSMPTSA